jgi:hypothetical protein
MKTSLYNASLNSTNLASPELLAVLSMNLWKKRRKGRKEWAILLILTAGLPF